MLIARRSDLLFSALLAVSLGVGLAFVGHRIAPGGVWLGPLAALATAALAGRRPLRRWRVTRADFPASWRRWLEHHVPVYARARRPEQRRFERDVQIFLAEHAFEGIGVEVTDDLKLMVAAGAALLLHGRPTWELPRGRTFLFYPEEFDDRYDLASEREPFENEDDIDGIVHPQGPVIFSAPSVEEGWSAAGDGNNVVLHELAHLFDFDNEDADGVPSLMDAASVDAWQRLVRKEMRRARMGKSLLSRYAATHPAELFAVGVERFFERPVDMAAMHPELFGALANFFNLDPRPPDTQTPTDAATSLMARRWG